MHSPVGAGLPAIAAWQPTNMPAGKPPSQASQLPQCDVGFKKMKFYLGNIQQLLGKMSPLLV
ncbi:hypothetical protein C1X27_23875 [Pseudomonas sp. MPR-AND1B]|nr:hypothetical protein C1X24_23205 [Pseudomonas sp. FW305-124]PMZ68390.1 hypothetical protein C1X25_23500 [Pseudomonas sp. GW247-3R2A]PNA88914.1 hypothetical protein C1X23_23900 [Pseudomonas sp. FW300-E2]PNA97708.1 hypothetical protein C1X27_23875 [Pseudomonas sp. MPR-AND1B]POH41126.1 hypothetical protein C2U56_12495 [Pseudomonas fluorescens]PTT10188.1 hypothetical protein DBR14_17625 [Pseudomonas sp. HMWF034]PVV67393.1 hypothetical protein DD985_21155 [Pseudomonas sp. HMWF011]